MPWKNARHSQFCELAAERALTAQGGV